MAFLPLSPSDLAALLEAPIRAAVETAIGPITEAAVNDEGTTVRALRLNGGWVLRRARSAAVDLAGEADRLAAVGAALPAALRGLIPQPVAGGRGWLLHPLLAGQPTTRRRLHALPDAARGRFLGEFGAFLHQLHGIAVLPARPAATPHAASQWRALAAEAEARLFPAVSESLAEDLRAALTAMIAAPLPVGTAFIHDDLHPSHILHDPASGRFTGLLDFGRAGHGDAAVDLAGLLYNWGEALIGGLAYPGIAARLPAAARLARTYEMQWALEGLTRGDPRWFLYALGGAKDF